MDSFVKTVVTEEAKRIAVTREPDAHGLPRG
jgi:hypothetical protein